MSYDPEALNARVWADSDLERVSRPRYAYGPCSISGYAQIVDPESDFEEIDRVPLSLVLASPASVLWLIQRNRMEAYNHGERFGRWAAQSDVLRALGIDDLVLRLRRDLAEQDRRP